MPPVAIMTDSAADMAPELQEKHGITVVPLTVRFGLETFVDGVMTPDEFWAKTLSGGEHPATSQPSVGTFEEAFRPWVEKGYQVVCITVTSKHSGTYNSAQVAAQSFPGQVYAFDSLALSAVQAHQAISAARLAREGQSAAAILAALESIRSRTFVFINLDTIEYLRKGGRASQSMPALVKLVRFLSIKPLVGMPDGQVTPFGATRSREKGMDRIVEEIGKRGTPEALVVLHTRQAETAQRFADRLAGHFHIPREEIRVTEVGAVLSSHAGPGVIAAGMVVKA